MCLSTERSVRMPAASSARPPFIDKETIMEQPSAFRNAARRTWTGTATGARRGKRRFVVDALPLASL
jgi:hypothetical protein